MYHKGDECANKGLRLDMNLPKVSFTRHKIAIVNSVLIKIMVCAVHTFVDKCAKSRSKII